MTPAEYAAKLVQLRRCHPDKLTQAQAAQRIGVRVQTLRENEKAGSAGGHYPYEKSRLKYGAFYGVDPDTLDPVPRVNTDVSDPRLQQGQDGSTVQPSHTMEGVVPTAGSDAAGQERSLKDLLFQIYEALGPRGAAWVGIGMKAAGFGDKFQWPETLGKTKAGGDQ